VCAGGEYISHACNGTQLSDETQCRACDACADNEYINGCDGSGFNGSNRTCRSCVECAPLHFPKVPCKGYGVAALQNCTACPTCPAGQYVTGGGTDKCGCTGCELCPTGEYIAACNASGSSVCQACDACDDGKYILQACDGMLFNVSNQQCVACEPCGHDKLMVGSCDGATLNCMDSPGCGIDHYIADGWNGTKSMLSCASCEMCAEDQTFVTNRCTGYDNQDTKTCETCRKCPDQMVAVFPCTEGIPTQDCIPNADANVSTIFKSNSFLSASVIQRAWTMHITNNYSLHEDISAFKLKFRKNLILSHRQPEIYMIIFEPNLSSDNLVFWTFYADQAAAHRARDTFSMSTFNAFREGARDAGLPTFTQKADIVYTKHSPKLVITLTLGGDITAAPSISASIATILNITRGNHLFMAISSMMRFFKRTFK
jgi:hypothetical protein